MIVVDKLQLVFYETKAVEKKFWFFDYDVKSLKLVRTKSGLLPTGRWELPFLSEQVQIFDYEAYSGLPRDFTSWLCVRAEAFWQHYN